MKTKLQGWELVETRFPLALKMEGDIWEGIQNDTRRWKGQENEFYPRVSRQKHALQGIQAGFWPRNFKSISLCYFILIRDYGVCEAGNEGNNITDATSLWEAHDSATQWLARGGVFLPASGRSGPTTKENKKCSFPLFLLYYTIQSKEKLKWNQPRAPPCRKTQHSH